MDGQTAPAFVASLFLYKNRTTLDIKKEDNINKVIKQCTMDFDMTYCLTAIGLTPGGSSTVHIYTQTIHRTTQSTQTIHRTTQLIFRNRASYI